MNKSCAFQKYCRNKQKIEKIENRTVDCCVHNCAEFLLHTKTNTYIIYHYIPVDVVVVVVDDSIDRSSSPFLVLVRLFATEAHSAFPPNEIDDDSP